MSDKWYAWKVYELPARLLDCKLTQLSTRGSDRNVYEIPGSTKDHNFVERFDRASDHCNVHKLVAMTRQQASINCLAQVSDCNVSKLPRTVVTNIERSLTSRTYTLITMSYNTIQYCAQHTTAIFPRRTTKMCRTLTTGGARDCKVVKILQYESSPTTKQSWN